MPNGHGDMPYDSNYGTGMGSPGAPYPRTVKAMRMGQGGVSMGVGDVPITGPASNDPMYDSEHEPYYGRGMGESGGMEGGMDSGMDSGMGNSDSMGGETEELFAEASGHSEGAGGGMDSGMSPGMSDSDPYAMTDDYDGDGMPDSDPYAMTDDYDGDGMPDSDPDMDAQMESVFGAAADADEGERNMGMDRGMQPDSGLSSAISDYKESRDMDYGQGMDSGGGMGMDRSSMEYRGMPNRPMYRSRGGRGRMRY